MRSWRLVLPIGLSLFASVARADDAEVQARAIFRRLTGTSLTPNDPRLAQMTAAVRSGNALGAARVATDDKNFYKVTLRNWASPWSLKDGNPAAPFDDMQALAIGVVRDELDGRLILTGKFRYVSTQNGLPAESHLNNDHYQAIDDRGVDLKATLARRDGQLQSFPEQAGVLTSRSFQSEYVSAGTNRRATVYAFKNFLCTPIEVWRDPGLPEGYIRRDVNRSPSGNPSAYQRECRTCHAPMDAMTGAFAHFDFTGGAVQYFGPFNFPAKYNQNGSVYPDGYVTGDDSWENFATRHHNAAFGWRGPLEGKGIESFAKMIGDSKGFSSCMVKRAFAATCRRELKPADQEFVAQMADTLEADRYNLRKMFEKVAISANCN